MNASGWETADATLLFNWEAPRRRQLAIVTFIAGSLILHVLCFYIFQIVYRPTLVLLPPPARVNLITPSSEEGRTLLRWIEAEDPALASATLRPPDARGHTLPKLQHVPSYLSEDPKLKEAPPLVVDLRPPSAQPPGPVPMLHRQVPPAPREIPTRVFFSKELTDLGATQFPSTKFSASTNEQPNNVRFRIGIGVRGEVRYCFPLNSSGDPALDQLARQHLALARFPARASSAKAGAARSTIDTPRDLIWGTATVEWGNDVARPPSTSKAP
jgi:hypothetical protein